MSSEVDGNEKPSSQQGEEVSEDNPADKLQASFAVPKF